MNASFHFSFNTRLIFPHVDECRVLAWNMASAKSATKQDDMSWEEVGALGLRYAKIPLALICVEAFYWFLTMPSDTLAPIQVSEAWLWNEITNFLYGEGASTLSYHNGWLTRIDFYHPSFPFFNTVGLYVSDECAGVHEMIFLATLIMMTEGVPQKLKIKSVAVACVIVYILNLLRLVVFYPIALEDCLASPNDPACLVGMWTWHKMVYEWGFLVVLVLMWLVWFYKVGGPNRILDSSQASGDKWRVTLRPIVDWQRKHLATIGFTVLLIAFAVYNVTSNAEAMEAKRTAEMCDFSELITAQCQQAYNRWDDAIGYAWSLSALGLVFATTAIFTIERPDENGKWPSVVAKLEAQEEKERLAKEEQEKQEAQALADKRAQRKAGSWKKRGKQSDDSDEEE